MRHMLCVGFSTHVFGSRHSNRGEPSNWYVAHTKHVRFGGLALLDVFFAGPLCVWLHTKKSIQNTMASLDSSPSLGTHGPSLPLPTRR